MNPEQEPSNSSTKSFIPLAVIALIIIGAIVVYNMRSVSSSQNSQQEVATTINPTSAPEITGTTAPAQTGVSDSQYADGTYEATGSYTTPGGPREVNVSLTLEKGIITDSTFQGGAKDLMSQRFQKEFAENYKAQVIGKNIDQISLTKVAGSSLTPKGFNDAVSKIKQQANS